MTFNPTIHHRRSIRLKNYDYSQAGVYFITLCCTDKKHLFGKIIDGRMILNGCGKIAEEEWLHTPIIRNNIELAEFIIMPNHIHGIIIISEDSRTGEYDSPQRKRERGRQGKYDIQLQKIQGEYDSPQRERPRGTSNTIGAIIRGYKSVVTQKIRQLYGNPNMIIWQRDYYETIIRNEKAYNNIANYIMRNPEKWGADKFNSRTGELHSPYISGEL